MAKKSTKDDPAMARVRELWEAKQKEGWTQQRLGEAMGYPAESARKSVSQFLKSNDPHVSMLRRFAKAVDVAISSLVRGS
jgi:transcriptional regulator with XRE-family HTH domain